MAAPEVDRVIMKRGELDFTDPLQADSWVYGGNSEDEWDDSTGVEMALGGGAETAG